MEQTIGEIRDQSEIKLFNFKCVLGKFESPYIDYSQASFKAHNPIPVKDGDQKKIGFANVYTENNRLIAECSIDYHCAERLLIQNKEKLYALSHGFIDFYNDNVPYLTFYSKIKRAKTIIVLSIYLSQTKPTDPNIPEIEEIFI